MDSKGFDVIESESKTYEDALREAIKIKKDRGSTFNKCEFEVIEIGSREGLRKTFEKDLLKIPKWIRKIFI